MVCLSKSFRHELWLLNVIRLIISEINKRILSIYDKKKIYNEPYLDFITRIKIKKTYTKHYEIRGVDALLVRNINVKHEQTH